MIKLVITFKRRQGMDVQAFREYHRNVHAPLLFSIPEAELIHQFIISYPIINTAGQEPRFDALVEAWFETLEDIDTLFQAENFRSKVHPDHSEFIDLESVVRFATEEFVVTERD